MKNVTGTQGFNSHIKVAGEQLTVKRFDKLFVFGYETKNNHFTPKGESNYTRDNFNKSVTRARNTIFDLICSNVNQHPTVTGELVPPKFLTLTFKENITDIKEANYEFTKFNKRLSYMLYGEHRNVFKYVCVPEFQKRGAIHYHALYFNLPYVKFDDLSNTWSNGYIYIEATKDDIVDYAKYVAKYMNKNNSQGEELFDVYKEKNMLNQKRYFSSRGLKRPRLYKLNISEEYYWSLLDALNYCHQDTYVTKGEYLGVRNDYFTIENKQQVEDYIKILTEAHLSKYKHPVY